VLLVTGDEASCREGTALLGPGLTTVPVKWGLGGASARMLPPRKARERIEEGARKALGDLSAVQPYVPERPVEIRVEYKRTDAVDKLRRVPGVEIVGPREVVVRGDDWWTAWQSFFFYDS
jgi:D-amino peptidase